MERWSSYWNKAMGNTIWLLRVVQQTSKIKGWRITLKICKINTLRPRPNVRHFPDNIFKCIFLNEDV